MPDLRRRTFGPHPTAQDWRAASKADIEQALAADVIRRNPKLYAGYDEDAVKFVRNTMGPTKWDLLLAAESFGLAPQGTYLYPDERKRHHATKPQIGYGLSAFDDDEWSWSVERLREGSTVWGSGSETIADGVEYTRAEAVANIKKTLAGLGVDLKDAVRLPF